MTSINARRVLLATAFSGTLAFMAPTAIAQDDNAHLAQERAQVLRADGLDAGASTPGAIGDFINASRGRTNASASRLVLDRTHEGRNGRTHLSFRQEIDGLRVHGAYAKATLNRDGTLTHLIERTAPGNGRRVRAGVSGTDAISAAVEHAFGGPRSSDFFLAPPTAERVLIARQSGQLEDGFVVETWSAADNLLYETLVGSRGQIVSSELRTAEDSYNVYADHPGVSAQGIVNGPGTGNAESPAGWLAGSQTTRVIRGNNVSSYLDRDANNAIDGGGTTVTDGNFVAQHFPLQAPTFSDNQDVAVQNLFYFNNLIHDDLYRHGFVETTGNFQEDNFSRGGLASDSVNAEAQDGSGTNNANFATPADGSNPRMQMFLWTLTNPGRDGDLDSDIIWHEYGHGLTWRMIGSMSGAVSGAIGEGMSDVLAILHNNRDTVGEYSTNDPEGIRSSRYAGYLRTIGDFTGSSVHFDGEIYAATLWRLGELARAAGMTNEDVLDVVVDGMNFTPAGPDYIDMRDGILAASGGGFTCMVWNAFADFGMGDGASFVIRTGGNPNNRFQITESFTVPSACSGTPPPTGGAATVTGLSGSAALDGRRNWIATATVTVADSQGGSASGVLVAGNWSTGSSGSCTTSLAGTCPVPLSGLRVNRDLPVTYTVGTLNGQAATGAPLNVTISQP